MTKILIDRAVVEQALEALTPFVRGSWTPGLAVQAAAAMDRLKAALAEPQSTHSAACYQWHHKCAIAEVERLRAALAEPVQEPVAYSQGRTLHWHEGKGVSDAQLFAAPPRPKPLTEAEIDEVWNSLIATPDFSRVKIARAIERAHGITP